MKLKNGIQYFVLSVLLGLLGLVFLIVAGVLVHVLHGDFAGALKANWLTLYKALTYYPSGSKSHNLSLAAALMSFGFVLVAPFAVLFSKQSKTGQVHGDAKFASEKEVEKEGLFKEGGILIGLFCKRYLRFGGNEFVYLAAPTRSGKGVGLIIPNCLLWPNSLIVNDIKGENYAFTGAYRKYFLKQKIFYFNPWEEKTHRFNPFAYVSGDPNYIVKDLNFIASCLFPEDPKNPFWSQQAGALFVGLALLVLETPDIPKTIGEVLRQGTGYGKTLKNHLEGMLAARSYSDACQSYLNRFLSNSDDVLKNILSSFYAPLQIWESPLIDNATSANDFDFRLLRKEKMTIYLHTNAGDVGQVAVILNLLFSFALRENIGELPEQNPELKHNCLLMMDEFPAIGKIDIIQKSVGFIAGYGMRLFIVCQNYEQLEQVYDKEGAANLYSNTGMRIYYAPDDIKAAKHLCDSLGKKTVRVSNININNKDKAFSGQVSRSEQNSLHGQNLMEADEIMAMGTSKALIQRVGMRFFIYDRIQYFSDTLVSTEFFKTPNKKLMIDGAERIVPIALPLPASRLSEFIASVEKRKKANVPVDAQTASDDITTKFLSNNLPVVPPSEKHNALANDFGKALANA